MSFIFEKPRTSIGDSFAGGVASVADIYAAAREQMLYVDNTFASQAAMERAIDERNDEVFAATGIRPENPYRQNFSHSVRTGRTTETISLTKAMERWQGTIATAAARIPDQSVADRLNRSIEADAIRLARQSDEKLAQLMESRPGASKWLGAVAGGVAGSLRDPAQVATLMFGGGPGAGRLVAGRVLTVAAREAVINGTVEALLQPAVQAWREKAGLDHGLEEALRNVGFAAAFGGVLGGAGQLAGEAAARLSGRALDAASGLAIQDSRIAEPLRRAMAGDVAAAAERLSEIRTALPAAARGALDHVETLEHLDTTRPRSLAPEHHDLTVSRAHQEADALAAGDVLRGFEPDPAQIARITDAMAAPLVERQGQHRSLVGFLIDAGGIRDFQGELRALGADGVSERFRGRLVKDSGMDLDMAREAAEEAGYIGRAGETQTTTVADLLSAIDDEMRGNAVFAREDIAAASTRNDVELERGRIESTVARVARHAGPGVDDVIVREAAEISLKDGLEPFDALEQVYVREEAAGSRAVKEARSGDALPGWSDAELEAASAGRGPEPVADSQGAFSNPGKIDEAFLIEMGSPDELADLVIPGDDGSLVPIATYLEQIRTDQHLATIIKACRT